MDETTIQLVFKATHEIPAFPAIVAELVNDLNSSDASAARVANLIKLDPAISAGVLRVANSAAFAGERQISNVDSAIMILGFDVIQSIAMKSAISGMIQFQRTKPGAYSADALWEHSVATSIYAGCLARRIRRLESSEASTCGLLHDIGKVLLDSCYPAQVEKVLDPTTTLLGESLLAKEERILGACHTAFGARLAKRWNLSVSAELAIELHHHGNSPEILQGQTTHERDLVATVFVANQMAKMTGFAGNDNEIDLPSAAIMTRLGFDPDLLQAIAMIPPEIPRKIKAIVGR
jgi:putative nucleotidyltransferase with HDIG domain